MTEPLSIQVQPTPNPNAAKFTLNRVVAAQGVTYRASGDHPDWAARLLRIPGVTQVFALQSFITVSKAPEGDWGAIAPQVERALQASFTTATKEGAWDQASDAR
jgi:hypothetical protein